MDDLILEIEDLLDIIKDKRVLDAALVFSAQKIEHYEIAVYGSLYAWAAGLGYEEAAALLHKSLEEERKTDETLGMLAREGINQDAHKRAA